jgi:hypothetical protein
MWNRLDWPALGLAVGGGLLLLWGVVQVLTCGLTRGLLAVLSPFGCL